MSSQWPKDLAWERKTRPSWGPTRFSRSRRPLVLAICIVLLFLWFHLSGPQPEPPLPEFTVSPYHLVHLIPKPPKAAVTIAENKALPDLVSQDELDDSHEQESKGWDSCRAMWKMINEILHCLTPTSTIRKSSQRMRTIYNLTTWIFKMSGKQIVVTMKIPSYDEDTPTRSLSNIMKQPTETPWLKPRPKDIYTWRS